VAHFAALFGIAISEVLLGLTVLLLPWSRRRSVPWRDLAPMLIPLGVYVLMLLGSVAASYDPVASLRYLSDLFALSTLFMAPLLVRRERQVRFLVGVLIVLAALLACEGLAQYLLGDDDINRRIRGPFSHYMTFSGFLLISDLLLLAAMTYARRWRSVWRWAALAVINAALLGTYTRNAWVALALSLTVLILIRAPRLLAAYLPAAALFVVLAPVPVLQRVASIADLRDASNFDRLCMLKAGLAMVRERPFFGLGPDLVRERYALYRPLAAPRFEVPHLHNSWLQIAAEQGLPSLAAYLALTVASATVAWRSFVREGGHRGPRADLYVGVLVALLAFNLAGLFENNWGDTEVQQPILFVLAIPFCLRLAGKAVPADVAGEP
jgi:putative inorganic carbon (HCO3(-)) transporter